MNEGLSYGISREVALDFDRAVEVTREELQKEGFGVLTEIDVKATLKQKLDQDFRRYLILGACNPPLAYRAFQAELHIGLLLPCNVIVYETVPARSVVSAIDPMSMVQTVGENPDLVEVARQARLKLERALDGVAGRA